MSVSLHRMRYNNNKPKKTIQVLQTLTMSVVRGCALQYSELNEECLFIFYSRPILKNLITLLESWICTEVTNRN